MARRYYPIVENFDDVRGIKLEGPLGTVSAYAKQCPIHRSDGETKQSAIERIYRKISNDDRFNDKEIMLKIRRDEWQLRNYREEEYMLECDIYVINRPEDDLID